MTDATGCVVLASASTCNLPSPARGLVSARSHSAASVHMRRAAPCPLPVTTPSLHPSCFFHGMLMRGGCDGATGLTLGITVIDSQLIRGHQAPCCGPGPGVPFSLHAAAACGLQPTSVSALSSRARMSSGTDPGQGCHSPDIAAQASAGKCRAFAPGPWGGLFPGSAAG